MLPPHVWVHIGKFLKEELWPNFENDMGRLRENIGQFFDEGTASKINSIQKAYENKYGIAELVELSKNNPTEFNELHDQAKVKLANT